MNPDATKRKYKSLDKAVDIVNAAVVMRRSVKTDRERTLTVSAVVYSLACMCVYTDTDTDTVVLTQYNLKK
jgi:hypothetical protein